MEFTQKLNMKMCAIRWQLLECDTKKNPASINAGFQYAEIIQDADAMENFFASQLSFSGSSQFFSISLLVSTVLFR